MALVLGVGLAWIAFPLGQSLAGEMVRDALGRSVEKPKYGGVFVIARSTKPLGFDDAVVGGAWNAPTLALTQDELIFGNWAKGPTGSDEASWRYYTEPPTAVMAGNLCESWELTDPDTMVYHIRKGVHWHDKPPVNGREMTAEDVEFSLKRSWETPTSYNFRAVPWEKNLESIKASDKWTLVIKSLPGKAGKVYEFGAGYSKIYPPESLKQYGNMNDWRNALGTGPFVLTDYVEGSSCTFERNPNYWMKHPLHPEDRMPYPDGVKYLIIPDYSTRLAGLRTGKADHLEGVTWEDVAGLKKHSAELKYVKYLPGGSAAIFMKRSPGLPCSDIRVRKALSMSIDREAIVRDYYGGDAKILGWPVLPIPEFMSMYIPLEELPEPAREVWEYHPEKAKKLLGEAGYPDGFKTSVVCGNIYVDLLSIVKYQWAKIGVELHLDVREPGAWTTVGQERTYKELFASGVAPSAVFRFSRLVPGNINNFADIDDPVINELEASCLKNFFDWPKKAALYKEKVPYILEQAYIVVMPLPYSYTFWQPWLKGYTGESIVGYASATGEFARYPWIDKDLKKEKTGEK